MARDYSSRHDRDNRDNGRSKSAGRARPAATPNRPKKPAKTKPKAKASRRAAPARGRGPGAPIWIWGISLACLAVVAVSVYRIYMRKADGPPVSSQINVTLPSADQTSVDDQTSDHGNASTGSAAKSADTDQTGAAQKKPRFAFYKMLPNYHVEIPDNSPPRDATPNPAPSAPHEADAPDNETASSLPTPSSQPKQNANPSASNSSPDNTDNAGHGSVGGTNYVIQAGAFSAESDADRRKAQLALLGVTAEIIDVQTDSGRTVYRVQSDPVASSGRAQSLAQRLKSHGINTMIRQAD